MKPVLGIDITKNKTNEDFNGQEFVGAKVSAIQSDMLNNAVKKVEEQENKSKLPKSLGFVRWISLLLGLMCISGVFDALGEEDGPTLAQAYANAPYIFWIGGAGILIWAALTLWGKKKEKTVSESEETTRAISNAEQYIKNGYAELGVPADARNMDVLMFRYKEKDGKIVPQSFGPAVYIACDCKVFTMNDMLCLADVEHRYDFPLSELRRITMVNKNISIPAWNKETAPNEPPYKQYKLRTDNYGFVHFKPYYILELEHNGEVWGIYFPSYELPTVESLTGLHPENNN